MQAAWIRSSEPIMEKERYIFDNKVELKNQFYI